jgi:AbrB family looped-hinge helix DNA binding protein
MALTHLVAIDGAGRLVIPKALRDELGLEPGQPLRVAVRDGRLEIEPEPIDAELVERDGVLVITPTEPVVALSRDEVRRIIESTRR